MSGPCKDELHRLRRIEAAARAAWPAILRKMGEVQDPEQEMRHSEFMGFTALAKELSAAKNLSAQDEWPLLCVEDDPANSDYEEAKRVLKPGESPPEGARVWRCRRVQGGELVIGACAQSFAEFLVEDPDEVVTPSRFACWDDIGIRTLPGAEEALKRWADEYIEVDAFEIGPEVER